MAEFVSDFVFRISPVKEMRTRPRSHFARRVDMSTTTTKETREEKDKGKGKEKEQEKEKDQKKHPRDPAREVIETIVFVVVLVLLLKLFVTEAFVIPTGSMAETLYGYQKIIICAKCGHEFPVNSHDEVEGVAAVPGGKKVQQPLKDYVCPNCRYHGTIRSSDEWPNRTGDRVLVLKPLYHIRDPERGDVVVFKFPKTPQEGQIAANYIKRAMGFGGETIAIHRGDLYVTTSLDYSDERLFPRPDNKLDAWQPQYMYSNSGQAERLFEASRNAGFPAGPIGKLPPELAKHFQPLIDDKIISPEKSGFVPVRKGEGQLLASRRIVWDNDMQPHDLAGKVEPRWYDPTPNAGRWKTDNPDQPRAFTHPGSDLDWIRYRHLVWEWTSEKEIPPRFDPWRWGERLEKPSPGPVDNFLGYNASRSSAGQNEAPQHWVGDLILECEVDIPAGSEITLELSKGVNRFQAKFGNGQVTLARTGPLSAEFKNPSRPCKVNAGVYKLRFANVDSRLWVWVDGRKIDFGTESEYSPVEPEKFEPEDSRKEGWQRVNDIEAPASIGAKGPVTNIRAIKLHRDVYYTWFHGPPSNNQRAEIYYVQPGHFLCLGDNSAHSSDSRDWGAVPERLMLGKAVFVFWPAYPPPNRVGLIR
jgi:signal peptidase I